MKYILTTIATLVLCACTSTGSITTKPSQIDLAKTAQMTQSDVDWGCFIIQGGSISFDAFAPALKVSPEGQAIKADVAAALSDFCGKDKHIDVKDIPNVVQRLYDLGGRIAAVVAKAQQS